MIFEQTTLDVHYPHFFPNPRDYSIRLNSNDDIMGQLRAIPEDRINHLAKARMIDQNDDANGASFDFDSETKALLVSALLNGNPTLPASSHTRESNGYVLLPPTNANSNGTTREPFNHGFALYWIMALDRRIQHLQEIRQWLRLHQLGSIQLNADTNPSSQAFPTRVADPNQQQLV